MSNMSSQSHAWDQFDLARQRLLREFAEAVRHEPAKLCREELAATVSALEQIADLEGGQS